MYLWRQAPLTYRQNKFKKSRIMPQTELPVIRPLPVQHREQKQLADCLAACAAMVLDYLHKPVAYERLLYLLEIGPIGAPRRNILHLSQIGISVVYREASLTIIAECLTHGQPVIAFVDTGELTSYWETTTNHAVVIVGLQPDTVSLLDPAHPSTICQVPVEEFLLAWLNCDYTCAILE
jgi:ABC-type bacteriocin/lantibiotic exporter with double-glycine peptidase domain